MKNPRWKWCCAAVIANPAWAVGLFALMVAAGRPDVAPPSLYDRIASDPSTIWYDEQSLPKVMESSGRLYRVGYNLAGPLDKTGSGNNELPWNVTGGLHDCGPNVSVKRALWMPPNKKIELYTHRETIRGGPRNGLDFNRSAGRYPVGTTVVEWLYDGIRVFEIRSRTKVAFEDWETEQLELGPKPQGYVAVENCVKCHEDVGKHAMQLDPARDWYATNKGLERNGPIHFHPFAWERAYQQNIGFWPEVREDMEDRVVDNRDPRLAALRRR